MPLKAPRRFTVDVVSHVISMVPAPYLQPAFEIFKVIISRIDQAQANQRQIRIIAHTTAQILSALNSRRTVPSDTQEEEKWMLVACSKFEELLSRVAKFCAKSAQKKAIKSFLDATDDQQEINFIYTQLSLSVDSFQISSQVSIQNFNKAVEEARQEDQAEIDAALNQLNKKQGTLLALVGKPNVESVSLDPNEHQALESVADKTIFGLLGDIQESVQVPTSNTRNKSEVLQEVLMELRKISLTPAQPPPTVPNAVVANLKPGLTTDVLITPLKWQMNNYMHKDQLTQHLDFEQVRRFTHGADGSKKFVEYLTATDDVAFHYSALELFRKDKTVKHFFKPGR